MDFRTEWSSWVMVVLMMLIAFFTYPYDPGNNLGATIMQVLGLPIASIAIASIPVLIICYFIKVIPDIDYSIRLAFVYMLFVLGKHFL